MNYNTQHSEHTQIQRTRKERALSEFGLFEACFIIIAKGTSKSLLLENCLSYISLRNFGKILVSLGSRHSTGGRQFSYKQSDYLIINWLTGRLNLISLRIQVLL